MDKSEEHKHVEGLRKDREASFEAVFDYFFPRLMNFAIEYVRDSEVAREIVQDTLLKLWEIRKNLAPDTRLSSLLYTIARNDALNYLKQLIHKQKYIDDRKKLYENQLHYIALKDESSEKLIYNELNDKIQQIINDLPDKCRQTFVLSRFEGLKYREIAERLNVSLKTVETHMSEALKKLRTGLKEMD